MDMKLKKAMLTTLDNPYDPFEDFSNWFIYDNERGYNSSAYLARIARTSDALSEQENDAIIEAAIDEIVRLDPFNIYKKVVRYTDEEE